MPCRQRFGPGAVNLVQALAPRKMQPLCNFVDTWRWLFLQSAIHGDPNFVGITPQLNAPIIAKRSDIEAGARRIAKQLDDRHPDLVTHPQKSADLRPVHARYPVSQRAPRRPREIRERQDVPGRGGSNARGQVGTETFPQGKPLQFRGRSEQITDRFRDPNLTFKIRFAH
jgi:hypothetical protein